MAKPPERSKPIVRKSAAVQDYFLEPLPVPDATESNTDTAWGLWEHSLKSHEEGGLPTTQAAELQDFPETEHGHLVPEVLPEAAALIRKNSEPKN